MKRGMPQYLRQQYGDLGEAIYKKQQTILTRCVQQITDRTNTQRRTMMKIILPRVALYQALLTHGLTEEEAVGEVGRYLVYELGPQARTFQRLDQIPLFFPLFKRVFLKAIQGDNWSTRQIVSETDRFSFEITECLWYNTCVEHGCPNLCRVFCENDNLLYGDLKHIGFDRSGTIALGHEQCDFLFYKM